MARSIHVILHVRVLTYHCPSARELQAAAFLIFLLLCFFHCILSITDWRNWHPTDLFSFYYSGLHRSCPSNVLNTIFFRYWQSTLLFRTPPTSRRHLGSARSTAWAFGTEHCCLLVFIFITLTINIFYQEHKYNFSYYSSAFFLTLRPISSFPPGIQIGLQTSFSWARSREKMVVYRWVR